VGEIPITEKQADKLNLPERCRISPFLEKCCLRIAANESYKNAEEELAILTGIEVGHSTLHRLVQRTEFSPPDAKQTVTELSVDGGKVRVRTEPGQSCEWLEYKAIRLQEIYYNADERRPLISE